jgi:HTH-type transcriptional regulator, competence development regulator
VSKEKLPDLLRRLRLEYKLPLRKVAALLDMDVAILSKMERGERKLNKEIVLKMAEIYHHDPDELVIMYLSEKIVYEVGDEALALKGLLAAEGEIRYRARPKELSREEVMSKFKVYFETQPWASKAWLFGSLARGENTPDSDIDICIDVPDDIIFSLFDLAEIQEKLQNIANKKVDVVMWGGLRPAMKARIEKEMMLIYEKE